MITARKSPDPAALRRAAAERRRALPPDRIASASRRIARLAWQLPELQRAAKIAAYWPVRGEVDTTSLMSDAVARGRRVYLPVIQGEVLGFAAWRPGAALLRAEYGIPEPAAGAKNTCKANDLNVVLMPLLAFDARGNRVGSGGGFYDRTFEFRRRRNAFRRPVLIGIAYEFQKAAKLSPQVWDVPLDIVVTEEGIYRA